jgi:hypothetical protein
MTEIHLGLGVLDHQLVDSDLHRCGKVDDLELDGIREGRPRVTEILVGPAWEERGAIGRLAGRMAKRLGRGRLVHVPWAEVERIRFGVRLRKPAHELGLDRGEERARRIVERIPGAWL